VESAVRRGARAYGLSFLVFLVPGLVGFVVLKAVGWSEVAQAAVFGCGFTAWLIILVLEDRYDRDPITRPTWVMWLISLAGVVAGVGLWVAGDKNDSAQLLFRVVAVILVVAPSVVPIALRVQQLGKRDWTPADA
jgi:hypothetical protein